MAADLADRITGSFLGLAVGDALGAPVEGLKPGAIKNTYGTLRDFADPEAHLPREKIYKWRKPGAYTDDTQQALALLDSLLQDRGLQPERAAERLAALAKGAEFRFGVYRGTGKNFRLSITDLRQGVAWTESGRDTAGNGAAMRVAPVALYYYENPEIMADAVARASLLTHRNPLGVSAAAGVARVISKSLFLEEIPPGERAGLVADAAEFCRGTEKMLAQRYSLHFFDNYKQYLHLFSDALSLVADNFGREQKKVEELISRNANRYAGCEITRPTLGFALSSVVYAIYLAALHADDFEKAVAAAVNSGGDADTLGAMAGAMSGALHGASAIPERWLHGLANRKQLTVRAQALAARKWPGGKAEDLYEIEYGLTSREHQERLALMRKKGVDFPEKKQKQKKYAEPEPIQEKFDGKRFKRQLRRMEKWKKFLPPDSLDGE